MPESPALLSLLSSLECTVYAAGRQTMPGKWQLPPRVLPFHDLIHVESGEVRATVGATPCRLRNGQWLLLQAGVTHTLSVDNSHNLSVAVVHFDARLGPGLDLIHLIDSEPIIRMEDPIRSAQCLDGVISSHSRNSALGTLLANQWMRVLASMIAGTRTLGASIDSRIQKTLRFVHENYAHPVSAAELAKQAGVSTSHLRDLFVQSLGVTPMRYLQTVRIEKAKRFLNTTDRSIEHIALSTGWQDASSFVRTFRRKTGSTPAQHRRQSREIVDI